MSHKATNWAIQVRGLKPATKLVLWFLADHHNPSYGCFPAQKTLADEAEMARSTVRSHLGILEHKGLILRENSVDPETHRQNPTHYRLAFEEGFDEAWQAVHARDQMSDPVTGKGDETPDHGDRLTGETSVETGDVNPDGERLAVTENRSRNWDGDEAKAVTGFSPKPGPENDKSRDRNPVTNPVIEPLKEPVTRAGARDDAEGASRAPDAPQAESPVVDDGVGDDVVDDGSGETAKAKAPSKSSKSPKSPKSPGAPKRYSHSRRRKRRDRGSATGDGATGDRRSKIEPGSEADAAAALKRADEIKTEWRCRVICDGVMGIAPDRTALRMAGLDIRPTREAAHALAMEQAATPLGNRAAGLMRWADRFLNGEAVNDPIKTVRQLIESGRSPMWGDERRAAWRAYIAHVDEARRLAAQGSENDDDTGTTGDAMATDEKRGDAA